MSYSMAASLQSAVFQHLESDAALQSLVGSAIYDAAPPGQMPGTYVALGPEDVSDLSDQTHLGAAHEFTVTVVTDVAGFHAAKQVAAAISERLLDADLTLTRGRLIGLSFVRAKAERTAKGTQRTIDLRFRALVEDT